MHAARAPAEGHEAVCVSHQLPIWTLRRYVERKRLWHDPRRRQCGLASLTVVPLRRRDAGRHRLLRAGRAPGRAVARRPDGQGRLTCACAAAVLLARRAGGWPLAGCALGAARAQGAARTTTRTASSSARRTQRTPAPDVTGELLDGGAYDLADHRGQRRRGQLLGLAGARRAGPRPTTWRATYQATKASGVDVPRRQRPGRPGRGARRSQQGRVTYPSLFDPASRLALGFDVPPNAIPSTIILDRQGRIAVVIRGAVAPGALQPYRRADRRRAGVG